MVGHTFVLVLLSVLLLSSIFVYAEDIAYVLRSPNNPNKDYLDVFKELNLSVKLINDNDVRSVDFSKHRVLFVADDAKKLKNFKQIPVGNMPSLVANMFHPEDWGLTLDIGLIGANAPLQILLVDNGVRDAYTSCCYPNHLSIPLFFMSETNKATGFVNVAETSINEWLTEGVVQTLAPGERLLNNKVNQGRMCFFGITETSYWTSTSRRLFKECAE